MHPTFFDYNFVSYLCFLFSFKVFRSSYPSSLQGQVYSQSNQIHSPLRLVDIVHRCSPCRLHVWGQSRIRQLLQILFIKHYYSMKNILTLQLKQSLAIWSCAFYLDLSASDVMNMMQLLEKKTLILMVNDFKSSGVKEILNELYNRQIDLWKLTTLMTNHERH